MHARETAEDDGIGGNMEGERIAETDVKSLEIKDAMVVQWQKYRETHPDGAWLWAQPIRAPGAYCPVSRDTEGEWCVSTDGGHELLLEWRALAEKEVWGGT